jgi:hypothetical protein
LVESQWVLTHAALTEIVADPETTIGELIVAKTLIRAIEDGDYNRINGMMDRVLGKVRHAIEIKPIANPTLKMLNADGTPRMEATNEIIDGEVDDSD